MLVEGAPGDDLDIRVRLSVVMMTVGVVAIPACFRISGSAAFPTMVMSGLFTRRPFCSMTR